MYNDRWWLLLEEIFFLSVIIVGDVESFNARKAEQFLIFIDACR